MSTPAAAVLEGGGSGAGAGAGAGAGGAGAAAGAGQLPGGAGGAGAGPAGGGAGAGGAAANDQFWAGWTTPEQKDTRDWVANKNYADTFTLAKTARELEREAATLRSQVSLKGYPVDKVNADGTVTKADENQRKAWNATMGVPESPDKYEIPLPADNPYPQFKTMMAQEFHKIGVPAAMATQLAKGYEAAVTAMETQIREQENVTSRQALAELEREWGSAYQERVALAQRGKTWLAQEVGGLNDLQMRTLEAVLSTPKFMAAMWKIGAGNREGSFAGSDGGGQFGNSAAAAQAELDQLTADRSANKISDFEWRSEKFQTKLRALEQRIVAGMATQ